MRAIHINSETKQITEIDLPHLDWKHIRSAIPCQYVERVRLWDGKHYVWLDEEGLINDKWGTFFQLSNHSQPLAGNGLITSMDETGEDEAPAALSLDEVRANITFPSVRFTGTSLTLEKGSGIAILRNVANFKPNENE